VANEDNGSSFTRNITHLAQALFLKLCVPDSKDFIDDKNRYSTPAAARLAFDEDRVAYLAKLELCRIEADRDLTIVVDEAAQKLKAGFPGVTIWERQVQARPVFGVPTAAKMR